MTAIKSSTVSPLPRSFLILIRSMLIVESPDPLAFRPNPEALMGGGGGPDENDEQGSDAASADGIYRPPRLAPMPYIEPTSKEARARRARPAPHALASLAYLDPERPFMESATGLGIVPSMQ